MSRKRVLLFIISYNSEAVIETILKCIPEQVWHDEHLDTECLVIDDQSSDQTFYRVLQYSRSLPELKLTVLSNPKNQGYGGNQKIGFHYAIQKAFDVVVLLPNDWNHAATLPQMLAPVLSGEADVVLGSRMGNKPDGNKGRIPSYRWLANRLLTSLQNRILHSNFSEFQPGYRAYSVASLATVPFMLNSDNIDFDTDILIQMLDTRKNIKEVHVSSYYEDETVRANGIRQGLLRLRTALLSRIVPMGILYDPRFDYVRENEQYTLKIGYASSHQFALDHIHDGTSVLDLGCGPGFVTEQLARKHVRVISLDRHITARVRMNSDRVIEADIEEYDFQQANFSIDTILLLDILEHLKSPERLLNRLRDHYSGDNVALIVTTANIAFFVIRFGLMLGQFNYGRRGILDADHARLFTFYSLRRLIRDAGYEITEMEGIPAPFPLALGDNRFSRFLLSLNRQLIRVSRGLFAYQIAVVARPKPTLAQLLQSAVDTSEAMKTVYFK